MFRILVLDKRDSIRSAIKYLLYRYELVFSCDINDAVNKLKRDNIDMILINLPIENGLYSSLDILKEWTVKKKTIAIVDMISPDLLNEANEVGILAYIDKLDISRLPELVGRYLNQADTRILINERGEST